jgi:hypothetical protein
LDPNDFRSHNPRFSEENVDQNLRIVEEVRAIELDATSRQSDWRRTRSRTRSR